MFVFVFVFVLYIFHLDVIVILFTEQHALQSDTHANDEQLKTLQADHSTLKGDLANVQSEYNNLKRNLAIIQSENNALKGKNDVIDQENQSLTNLLESDRQKAKDGERKAADSLRKLEQERDTARRGYSLLLLFLPSFCSLSLPPPLPLPPRPLSNFSLGNMKQPSTQDH